ncbi:MAG: type III-B CRISPR module-associated Cmr3 family protein [Verrucomicrobiia bacterium]
MNTKEIIKTKLIEPIDVLFFRDAIPMGAGVGKGEGARLPFPTTLHEAFRASLLINTGKVVSAKTIPGRPREVVRKGNWHDEVKDSPVKIAAREFRSLCTVGPFPYLDGDGLFLPVPMDVAAAKEKENDRCEETEEGKKKFITIHRLELLWDKELAFNRDKNHDSILRCLPVSTCPPSKESELRGYFSIEQYKKYLSGSTEPILSPKKEPDFWQPEYRIGVQINPETFASVKGQIYAATYLRPQGKFRFACQLRLKDPRNGEAEALDNLNWLLFGGEHRLARLVNADSSNPFADDLFKAPQAPQVDGPILLKWVLVTPAIFAHGSLPGWCIENKGKNLPPGYVALDLKCRCALISWCIGRPITFSGFDVVDWKAKDTLLGVPAGSVYYFLCENRDAANELAKKLHWTPRSDYYGEKGCGYGFVSFDVRMHQTSGSVTELANHVFKQ